MSTFAQRPVLDHAVEAPRLNRQERVISLVYVVMCAMVVTFLAATSAIWLI
jgi:hypothetical protein